MVVSPMQQAAYAVLTLALMLGMGASLSRDAFRGVLERPRAYALGMLCQLGLLPLLGLAVVTLGQLDDTAAAGLLLMVAAGGGNMSNMLSFLSRSDVPLSLAMTATSTLTSLVAMPLMLAATTQLAPAAGWTIPWAPLVATLSIMALPIPLGMRLRHTHPHRAEQLQRGGQLAGGILVAMILASSAGDYVRVFSGLPGSVWLATLAISGGGMLTGAAIGRLASLPVTTWRALALETGVQNLPVALAVATLCFEGDTLAEVQAVTLLYSSSALVLGILLCLVTRSRAQA